MQIQAPWIFNVGTLTLGVAGAIAVASPTPVHHHQHIHAEKRDFEVTKTVEYYYPGVTAFVLNGKIVDQSQVCKGIDDGSLKWEDPADGASHCLSSTAKAIAEPTSTSIADGVSLSIPSVAFQEKNAQAAPALSSPASESSTGDVPNAPLHTVTTNSVPTTSAILSDPATNDPVQTTSTSSSESKSTVTSTTATSSSLETSSSQPSTISQGQGLELEFPDGIIDCSVFPSEYGPIEVEWANLGGWAGIQYITVEGDSVTNIVTAVPGGKGCIPGAMCSYACPPGFQKSQWPSAQGSTGQSVGGIQCNSAGKLALTNPGLSKSLCMKGTGATNVQNRLSNNAAICRTDYPGTENEIVPLNTQPESTSPLTCPDANSYFQWDGMPTSAQYYINNQGIAVEKACIWGADGSDMGNWAPSFLGVGQDIYGKTWLSISTTAENDPSGYSPLNYTVTIQGDISGNCRLSNGKYCSGDNYDNCNDQGCTVELMSGQGTYVLSD